MSKHLVLLSLFTLGCAPDTSTGRGPTVADDTGTAETCEVTIASTHPSDGATDFYYRDTLWFELSEPDPTATIEAPFAGTQTTSEDGLLITFTPDGPLEPDTPYEVALDYCHGTPAIGFSTSALGLPLEDGVSLEERVYAVDLAGGHFMDGAGVGETLSTFFARSVLMKVTRDEDAAIDILASVSDESIEQDYCKRTVEVADIDFSEAPFVSFGLDEFEFGAYLATVTLYDLSIEGTFSPDATEMGGVRFSTTVDAQDISEALGAVSTEVICELAEDLGTSCGPCPVGDTDSCLTVTADQIEGLQVSIELDAITEANTDPRCEEDEG